MSNTISIRLLEFYENADDITIGVDNDLVYMPDKAWTKAFAAGLQKLQAYGIFEDKTVMELGVGSGINLMGQMTSPKAPATYIGTDLNSHAITATMDLVKQYGLHPGLMVSNLFDNIPDFILEECGVITGCLPQIPSTKILSPRELGDYCEFTGLAEDNYGLGLQAKLLDHLNERDIQADVVLIIAGRPGEERIDNLFTSRGYISQHIHSITVQHDPTSNVASLAQIENHTGMPFSFYADPAKQAPIGAGEAEDKRLSDIPVYHEVHVIRGMRNLRMG